MKESTPYQAIKEEGREEGRLENARDDIRRLGARKFATSLPAEAGAILDSIFNIEQLQQILDRILVTDSWDELLAPSTGPQRRPRKKRQ